MNAIPGLTEWGFRPGWLLTSGLVLAAAGLAMRFAPQMGWRKLGSAVAVMGILLVGLWLPPLGPLLPQVLFWLMASVTLIGSGVSITARSPVYTAIWFAVSLLGVAGLLLLQGAYFLGASTIIVYAGAIIVTFLFVLMLAQPEGHTAYDRISWASFVPVAATTAAALLMGMLLNALPEFPTAGAPLQVLHESHVAHFGAELFARHLIAVEVAGALLLVALVGAIAIVIQGSPRRQGSSRFGGRAS